ncbi:MAG TPA: hypothetical protein VNF75_03475 [Candidatus Dormibacteraeota bacterium]|nr:hypothetical protein [Candidatus Dormibacteraeota bacterium]
MGLAIDTVLAEVTMATAAVSAAMTPATGDSFTVRSFAATDRGILEQLITKAAHTMTLNVKSPMFHDNVEGIQVISAQAPGVHDLPQDVGQPLTPQDTLSVIGFGTASDVLVALMVNYYTNLLGASARLHNWGDLAGNIKSMKVLEVACTSNATAGQWEDTVITTTENLLHANTDYAVLGYLTDVAVAAVGIKGQETGNLRICGPATVLTQDTTDYFIRQALRSGRPHIPVFNSANAGSVYASCCDSAASTAVKVQLMLAEMSQNLSS